MKNGLAWRIKNLSLAVYQKNSVLLFKLLWNCEWSSLHLKNVFFPSVYRWKRAHLVCRKRNSNVIPSTIVTSLCLEISPVRWHNGVKSCQKHHSEFTIFFIDTSITNLRREIENLLNSSEIKLTHYDSFRCWTILEIIGGVNYSQDREPAEQQ